MRRVGGVVEEKNEGIKEEICGRCHEISYQWSFGDENLILFPPPPCEMIFFLA